MNSTPRRAAVSWLLLSCSALLIAGCAANGYGQFFTSTLPTPVLTTRGVVPNLGEPVAYTGKDPQEDVIRMIEDGYLLVGYSSFVGPPQDPALAKAKARELHAAVVLLYSRNPQTITETTAAPDFSGFAAILNPKTETTQTTGTVYGAGGSLDYSQTSTKTLPAETRAPQTMTYTTTRYDQAATFWVKTKPPRLGVYPRDLTADERAARGSNKGIVVVAVTKGSPAFLADIMRGDVLTKVGDSQIAQSADLYTAIDRYAGSEVDIALVRGKDERIIRVRLNPTAP